MMTRLAVLLFLVIVASSANAGIVDYGPPQDVIGNWKFDLYDSANLQRGTSSNPLFTSIPADVAQAGGTITTQDLASTTVSQYAGQASASGTPTAASFQTFPLQSSETIMVVITGTWTGILQIEASADGGVTYQPRALHVLGSPIFSSSITANVVGAVNGAAKTHVRVRAVAAMTGTATVKALVSDNLSTVYVGAPVKVIDGTVTTTPAPMMAIKAGGTGALATDSAVVTETRPWLSRVLSGNATTTIKTGGGVLHIIISGAPTGGSIAAYDATTATGAQLVFMYAGTPSGGLLTTSGYPSPESVFLDVGFSTALTIVTAGSTNNSFTVIYR